MKNIWRDRTSLFKAILVQASICWDTLPKCFSKMRIFALLVLLLQMKLGLG